MDVFEALYTTRAMRRVKEDPIPDEIIKSMIDSAIRAPSGSNRQDWRFVAVTDQEVRTQLADIYKETWDYYVKSFYNNSSDLGASNLKDKIGIVWLNRPEKKNALNDELWFGLPELVKELDESDEVRVILIAAKGDTFSAGIDINLLVEAFDLNEDLKTNAKERIEIMEITKKFQDAFTTVAKTQKPTIAAIQGFSIGGATNLVASCDIRLSTKDAQFSIGESKLGLVADVGALQRMPKIISKGLLRELAYTGKTFDGEYAKEIGFVNHTFDTHEELINGAMELANEIASNSPLVMRGTKMILDKGEELTSDQSLDLVRMWSTSFLSSEDLKEGIFARMEKRDPKFKGQ